MDWNHLQCMTVDGGENLWYKWFWFGWANQNSLWDDGISKSTFVYYAIYQKSLNGKFIDMSCLKTCYFYANFISSHALNYASLNLSSKNVIPSMLTWHIILQFTGFAVERFFHASFTLGMKLIYSLLKLADLLNHTNDLNLKL